MTPECSDLKQPCDYANGFCGLGIQTEYSRQCSLLHEVWSFSCKGSKVGGDSTA